MQQQNQRKLGFGFLKFGWNLGFGRWGLTLLLAFSFLFFAHPTPVEAMTLAQCNSDCLAAGGSQACYDSCLQMERNGTLAGAATPTFRCNASWDGYGGELDIVGGIIDLITFFPKKLAEIVAYVTDKIILNTESGWPITNPDKGTASDKATVKAFISGWTSVRDLANMLIVLAFVIVGISTALRFRDYDAKKFLPLLIVMALLINFSNVLVGFMIDASDLTMKGLLRQGGVGGGVASGFFNNYSHTENVVLCNIKESSKESYSAILTYISVSVFFSIAYILISIAFIYLVIILIARYAILGILFMVSPLAFIMRAFPFPKAKDIWDKWWAALLKWSFIGVGVCFVLNLVSKMIEAHNAYAAKVDNPVMFWPLLLTMVTLIIGIKMTTKSSGLASNFVTGAMGAMAGFGLGAAKLAGKSALDRTGLSRAGAAAKDKVTSGLERMNLLQQGYTKNAQQKRLDRAKGMENKYEDTEQGNRELANIAQGRGVGAGLGPQAAENRAKAAQILAQRKKLDFIPKEKQASAVAHALAMGASSDTFKESGGVLAEAQAQQGIIGSGKRALEAAAGSGVARAVVGAGKAMNEAKGTAIGGAIAGGIAGGLATGGIGAIPGAFAGAAAAAGAKKAGKKGVKAISEFSTKDSLTQEATQRLRDEEQVRFEATMSPEDAAAAAKGYNPNEDSINIAKDAILKDRKAIEKIGYAPPTKSDVNAELQRRGITTGKMADYKNVEKELIAQRMQEKMYGYTSATETDVRKEKIKEIREANPNMQSELVEASANSYVSRLSAPDLDNRIKEINTKRKEEGIKKLTVSKMREAPDPILEDEDFVMKSNYGTLDRAWLEFTTEQKDKVKKHAPKLLGKIESEINTHFGAVPKNMGDIEDALETWRASPNKAEREKGEEIEELVEKYLMLK